MHEDADAVRKRAADSAGPPAGPPGSGPGSGLGGGRRCAFLAAAGPHDLEVDDHLARAPLEALGWSLETVPWDRAEEWAHFDLVVVRSAWDYHGAVQRFEATLDRIHRSGTVLANPLNVLRWNLRKTYLLDLQARGVPVVPTRAVDGLEPGSLAALHEELTVDGSDPGATGATELVVKSVVGANGDDVYRVGADSGSHRAVEAAFRDRPALVQPFLPAVLTEGEVSLVYMGGELSHGLRKRPREGEFRTQEERGAAIAPLRPGRALREVGDRALAAVDGPTLYARVDLIPDAAGAWRLVELELVEPSLYLRTDPEAPARFARAIRDWPRPSV